MSLHGAKFNWKCDKCDYSVRYAATLVKHRALHLINPNFRANENADASLLLGLAEGDAEVNADAIADVIADVVIPSNIKLKLNLKQICTSNGSAVTTGEEQPIESADSSSVGGDEELKSDDGEMAVEEEEEDVQEDIDSIVDGSPDLVVNEEEEDDVDEEVEAVVDSDSLLLNSIAIETK